MSNENNTPDPWTEYVRAFYAAAPADRDKAWAALSEDDRAAFNATRDYMDVVGEQKSLRTVRIVWAGIFATVGMMVLLSWLGNQGSSGSAGRAPFDNDKSTCVTKKIVRGGPLNRGKQQIHCSDGRKFVIPMGE